MAPNRSPRSNTAAVTGIQCAHRYQLTVAEEDPMSKHAASLTTGVLAGALYLAGSFSATAQGVSPPNFAPTSSTSWFAYSRAWIPPASGAGPVLQDPARPHVTNDEFRVTGRQPTQ